MYFKRISELVAKLRAGDKSVLDELAMEASRLISAFMQDGVKERTGNC